MSKLGMTITVLCTGLVDAVAKDESPEEGGCDISAGLFGPNLSQWLRDVAKTIDEGGQGAPIDMVLHCPSCGTQHIDAPEPNPDWCEGCNPDNCEGCGARSTGKWANPPHRSHLCHDCGHIWRPADVATNGVAAVKTQGKADSPKVTK